MAFNKQPRTSNLLPSGEAAPTVWHLNIGAALLLAVGFGALFFSAAGDTYANPSLVVNGTFDSDVANWTEVSAPDVDLAWDGAVDLNDDSNSGSALVTFTGTAPGSAEIISDCITLTGDATYPYQAWVRPGTQWTTDDSTANIDFVRWDAASCAGTSVTNSHGATTIGNAGGGWVELSGNLVVAGANNVSMQIRLRVTGDATGDSAWWDEVKIANTALDTPTPTSTRTATATLTPTVTYTPATVTATPSPEPSPDTDGDGYSDALEISIGQNSNLFCSIMRADVDGNSEVNSGDLLRVALSYGLWNEVVRADQDLNTSVNSMDLLKVALDFANSVSDCATVGPLPGWYDDPFERTVMELINDRRQSEGLTAVARESRLEQSAKDYAKVLADHNHFSHIGPDGSTLVSRVEAAGFPFTVQLGEVIAWGSHNWPPASIVQAWMDSPSHREQVLGSQYGRAGVGCYFTRPGTLMVRCVAVFAAGP